jgi:dTDP-L-rhamnose 4-epimerase
MRGLQVLVTGGAGFIGGHLVDNLIKRGCRVRIFDNLDPQVHGKDQRIPEYLNKEAEFLKGDMLNRNQLRKAIKDVEIIFHNAAVVGVGQSMYEIERYVRNNTIGTAILWDILANEPHKVQKIIIASSMSNYGEGAYECKNCGIIFPKLRKLEQLRFREWEIKCENCKEELNPLPTKEEKPLSPTSIYALTKRDQEEMSLVLGKAYKIPVVILRYFNTYGQRQSLSNPYTGVAAISLSRILNNKPPIIFEDGLQTRDFIHVKDVVQANLLAMENDKINFEVFNIASGEPVTIRDIVNLLIKKLNSNLEPQILGKFREGDVRHCFADISKAKKKMNFEPKIKLEEGIEDLINWASTKTSIDLTEVAIKELEERGLTK